MITIPSPAKEVIEEWTGEILNINSDFISGIYLTGSITLDDFHPDKSDIDFLVVCTLPPGKDHFDQLRKVHQHIEKKYKSPVLNGSYITLENLNIHQPHSEVLHFQDGKFTKSVFEMAPIKLYEIKKNAISLFGMTVEDLPLVIQTKDVDKFLFDNINSYWKNWIESHSSFTKCRVLLMFFPRLTEWVILGLARQLFTLHTGMITSKTKAGHFCLQHLPAEHHPIIMEAIQIRHDNSHHQLVLKGSYSISPSFKRVRETLQCARYLISHFNRQYNIKLSHHKMWDEFINRNPDYSGKNITGSYYFCDTQKDADECADLVIKGIKQATSTSVWWLKKNNAAMPKVGDLNIVTDWNGHPKAIVEVTKVEQIKFKDITPEYAFIEGEGDKSLSYWKKVHWEYYSREMSPYNVTPDENMIIICEYFRTIHI